MEGWREELGFGPIYLEHCHGLGANGGQRELLELGEVARRGFGSEGRLLRHLDEAGDSYI